MQSKLFPKPGGWPFQLKDYYTGIVPPQDILDRVTAQITRMEREAQDPNNSEATRSSYRYSIMVLRGQLPPVRS